jgi:hypothetical protein
LCHESLFLAFGSLFGCPALPTSVFFPGLLFSLVFDEFFLLLKNLEFLFVAGLFTVNLELGFAELNPIMSSLPRAVR